jgi:hypothetical protein
MKKFAIYPIDVTDMVLEGKIEYLSKITSNLDEQIKEAHIPSLEELLDKPTEDFALVLYHPQFGEMKKLATYDKSLTEINMAIFLDKMKELPEEINKVAGHYLCKAAKYFKINIPDEIVKYATAKTHSNRVNITEINELNYLTKTAQLAKKANAASYALPKQEKYPLDNADLVKTAVAYFERYLSQFTPSQRLEYAENVKIVANKHNIDIVDTNIQKYAYLNSSEFSKQFPDHIAIRQSYVSEDDKLAYAELLEKSSELGVTKTASLLEKLDKHANINRLWDVCITDPVLAVHGEKETMFVKHGNLNITDVDLKAMTEHKDIDKYIDASTKNDLLTDEGLDIFESLPSPIKDKLITLK